MTAHTHLSITLNKHNDMSYTVRFTRDARGSVSAKEEGDLAATVRETHETVERHCDHCGAPMTPSDVNDYGTLCETCYMAEYYGE